MSAERAEAGWKLWGLWAGASAFGWAAGLVGGLVVAPVLALPVFFLVAYTDGFEPVYAVSVGVMFGSVLGVYQWCILQRRISRPGWWVLASALGGAVGWLAFLLADLGGGAVDTADLGWTWTLFDGSQVGFKVGAMTGAMVGISIGIAQWLVLWQRLSRAGWWILASAVGWAAGWAVGWALGGIGPLVVPGGLGGAITGAALVWLLRHQRPDRRAGETLPAASDAQGQAYEQVE